MRERVEKGQMELLRRANCSVSALYCVCVKIVPM